MKIMKYVAMTAALTLGSAGIADAAEFNLRIQTHFSAESLNGKNVAQFVDDVAVMSGGRIDVEMFYSASVVKSTETFDAAANGVLDGDMTGGAYQTGRTRPSSSLATSWVATTHHGNNIPGFIMAAAWKKPKNSTTNTACN